MPESPNTTSDSLAEKQNPELRPSARRRERRCYLADLAEEVGNTYCPDGPVDPLMIARRKRITYSFGDYGDAFDGMLEYRRGRFHIYASTPRLGPPDSPRARFTVAHELGHYFIDEHRHALAAGRVAPHPSLCDFESGILAEEEADHFASHLLMPEKRFRRTAASQPRGLSGVLALAEAYQTPITSTAFRFAGTDLFPCVVIKWMCRRHEWRWFSSSMFTMPLREVLKAPSRLPDDSSTRLALTQAVPEEGSFFIGGTLASVWFPRVRRGSPLDVVLLEEAMPLGRHGALTMLYPSLDCRVFDRPARRIPGRG